MVSSKFDVLTVGNAIVDIIARAEDDFLVRENIIKAAMNLIDADRAEHLYSVMGPAIEASGGSAGNTARPASQVWVGGRPILVKWLMITWAEFSPMISAQLVFILKQSRWLLRHPPRVR